LPGDRAHRSATLLTAGRLPRRQRLEEQRIAIEELEALRELNDELEENHVETEKQLQEEIGA
jgi:dynactin 1